MDVPVSVKPYSVHWIYVATIAFVHLLALLALHPYFFSWAGVVVAVIGIHVFGQGITIGYHRLLTHRSFQCPLWVERTFAILGICCMEDTPAKWVAIHRMHHASSDDQPDPHSPLVNFLWSHFGWLCVNNSQTHSLSAIEKFSKDLLRDPFYMYFEKRPLTHVYIALLQMPVFFVLGMLIEYFLGGSDRMIQMGMSMMIWGVFVRLVAVWHITWSVNSLSHLFGYQNYETGEHSKNNWFVALLTVGEGWHNNHHHDPSTACLQHRWWEIDISYLEIKLLEKFGLASSVIAPRHLRRNLSGSAK